MRKEKVQVLILNMVKIIKTSNFDESNTVYKCNRPVSQLRAQHASNTKAQKLNRKNLEQIMMKAKPVTPNKE